MKSTNHALADLGVPADALSDDQRKQLDWDGLVVLPNAIDMHTLETMRSRLAELHAIEGVSAGTEVNKEPGADRLSDLVNKDPIFDICFTHPQVLAATAHVLNDFKLSSVCSRAPNPGQGNQRLHADWEGGPARGDYQVCNSIWMLDDFTTSNGPTRYVAGSHRYPATPNAMAADMTGPQPGQQLLVGKAGTVVVFNGHLWHGGTENFSGLPRRSLMAFYTRRHNPQQVDQAARATPATLARLGPAARFLLDL